MEIPQASAEPLFMATAVVEPLPEAPNCTVTSWQLTVGTTLSSTSTFAPQVAVFPLLSVTVKVTGLLPTSPQVKSVVDKTVEEIPQASAEVLCTAPAVVDPTPKASNCTVTS